MDISQLKPWTNEHKVLIRGFVHFINAYRREEFQVDPRDLEETHQIREFLKTNSRSIPPELLSVSSKTQRGSYDKDCIDIACKLIDSLPPQRSKDKREFKVIFELCLKIKNYFSKQKALTEKEQNREVSM